MPLTGIDPWMYASNPAPRNEKHVGGDSRFWKQTVSKKEYGTVRISLVEHCRPSSVSTQQSSNVNEHTEAT